MPGLCGQLCKRDFTQNAHQQLQGQGPDLCLPCGETEAHSSHETVPHRKEVAEYGEGVSSLPHRSTLGPCVSLPSSQSPGFPEEICSILSVDMSVLITSTFPSRLHSASPPPGGLPRFSHALCAGALLLGPFLLFVFCLHIRGRAGPQLPYPTFCPQFLQAGSVAEKRGWFPSVRLEPWSSVFPQGPFQNIKQFLLSAFYFF